LGGIYVGLAGGAGDGVVGGAAFMNLNAKDKSKV